MLYHKDQDYFNGDMLYQLLILLNLLLPHQNSVTLIVETDRPAILYINQIYQGITPKKVTLARGKRHQVRVIDLINNYERERIIYPKKNSRLKILFNSHFRLISLKRSLSLNYLRHEHYLYPAIFNFNIELKLINSRFEFAHFTLKTTLLGSETYLSTENSRNQAFFLGEISLIFFNHLLLDFKIHPIPSNYSTLRGALIEPVAVSKLRYTLPLNLPFKNILFFKTYWTKSETLYNSFALDDLYYFVEMGLEISGTF